jgi:ribosomal protein S18 acetylase RimI-like enzyme
MMAKWPAVRSVTAVRNAGPSDAERLAELHVTTWQQAYAGLLPEDYLLSLSASQRLPMWQQLLDSGDRAAIFVADFEEKPIGFASGGGSNDEGISAETGEMWTLYLLHQFWGQGIGRQLHDTLLAELERQGFVEATLWVLESNERTRRWYEKRGWKLDGSRKATELWGAQITEVRYRKMLGTQP